MELNTYANAAMKTAASSLHPDKIDTHELGVAMMAMATVGHVLDVMKKGLVYGRDTPVKGLEDLAMQYVDRMENQHGLVEDDTQVDLSAVPEDVTHAILGILTEAAELAEAWTLAVFGKKPLDLVNLKEESGDGLWYHALLARGAGYTLNQAAGANIRKLAARYGERFSELRALVRDLDTERAILEDKEAA